MPTPPGLVAWRIVGTRGVTILPQLKTHAPVRVKRGYFSRVIANLTGQCPLCLQAAWIDADAPDPETHPAGWALLTITIGVHHVTGCAALMEERDRKWFDPRAVGR
jgi:hypothetical protein